MEAFKIPPGVRVSWQYTHHLNHASSVERVKVGIFHRLVRHSDKHQGPQLAAVKFDDNRTVSKVPALELRVAKELRQPADRLELFATKSKEIEP